MGANALWSSSEAKPAETWRAYCRRSVRPAAAKVLMESWTEQREVQSPGGCSALSHGGGFSSAARSRWRPL
jgi:hypothetical protein